MCESNSKIRFDMNCLGLDLLAFLIIVFCQSVVRFKEVWNRMQEARISPNGEVLDVLLLVLHKTNCTNELLRVMMELPKAYKVKRTGKNFLLAMKNCIHNKRVNASLLGSGE